VVDYGSVPLLSFIRTTRIGAANPPLHEVGGLGMLIQPFHMIICLTSSTIERIAFRATMEGMVPAKGGVQRKLDKLAERSDFKEILREEVTKTSLSLKTSINVEKIYHEVSKHAHNGVLLK
jgi:hypothetical protein